MSVVDDFKTLFQELGNEFSVLGRDLHVIAEETLIEIKNDPVSYISDSTTEFGSMGLCHPLLGKRYETNTHSRRWCAPVIPVEKSILYTDLVGDYAQHFGVYIGHDRIVDLSRYGKSRLFRPGNS